jgi:membrane-associated phospholipid phosphatase
VGLFRGGDVAIVGALLTAQVALFAFDDEIHRAAASMRSDATNDVASAFRPLGRKPPWYLASAAAYAIGKVAGEPRVADVALHAVVSLAVANAITGGLKGLTGRFRPIVLDVTGTDSVWVARDPDEWGLLAGWRDGAARQSWPSGHATAAFAVAAVLAEELGGVTPWIAYPIAMGVAWSRVNDEAHWATDVLMGALVGSVTARLVVRRGHAPGGWLERTLLLERDPYGSGIRVGLRVR